MEFNCASLDRLVKIVGLEILVAERVSIRLEPCEIYRKIRWTACFSGYVDRSGLVRDPLVRRPTHPFAIKKIPIDDTNQILLWESRGMSE